MKQEPASDWSPSNGDRIRQLGFDPSYLTSAEQAELLEIELRLAATAPQPDPALSRR